MERMEIATHSTYALCLTGCFQAPPRHSRSFAHAAPALFFATQIQSKHSAVPSQMPDGHVSPNLVGVRFTHVLFDGFFGAARAGAAGPALSPRS